METPQPIYLLADSQMLFWRDPTRDHALLLAPVRARFPSSPLAAYVGASNGDAPEYYEIFTEAMAAVGVTRCCMIRSTLPPEDEARLVQADIILLAGGGVERGWNAICATGMRELIVRRYRAGATLIGLSAGAVQLGSHGVREQDGLSPELFGTLRLCPFVVGAHHEHAGWPQLVDAVQQLDQGSRGIGIRTGAALIVHDSEQVEIVRYPADEFRWIDGQVVRRVLPARE